MPSSGPATEDDEPRVPRTRFSPSFSGSYSPSPSDSFFCLLGNFFLALSTGSVPKRRKHAGESAISARTGADPSFDRRPPPARPLSSSLRSKVTFTSVKHVSPLPADGSTRSETAPARSPRTASAENGLLHPTAVGEARPVDLLLPSSAGATGGAPQISLNSKTTQTPEGFLSPLHPSRC